MDISPAAGLLTAVGDTLQFTALALDAAGNILSGPFLVWRSFDRDVATIDPSTGLATARSPGTAEIRATSGSANGTATLEVYIDTTTSFTPGETRFGRNDYVEYLVGDLPVIVTSPHGGAERPEEMSDRTSGSAEIEEATQETARVIAAAIAQRTGKTPHLIVSNVHRLRMDADADVDLGAQNNPFAKHAWGEYQRFIEVAKQRVNSDFGAGIHIAIHGHEHPADRVELGYLLPDRLLALSDAELDAPDIVATSSIRSLASQSDTAFHGLVRGPSSLGGLLEQGGVAAVPSPNNPSPGGEPYSTGGYSVGRHGSRDGGSISAVEVQAQLPGVRDNATNRQAFADAVTLALEALLTIHLGIDWE